MSVDIIAHSLGTAHKKDSLAACTAEDCGSWGAIAILSGYKMVFALSCDSISNETLTVLEGRAMAKHDDVVRIYRMS